MAQPKTIVRKYRFANPAEYFAWQRKNYKGRPASRYSATDESLDTHVRLAKRMGCSVTTISRVVAGLSDPSYELAVKIARDIDCPADSMGRSGVE
jgi:transcriptional regulator with XRE-family HTH domain